MIAFEIYILCVLDWFLKNYLVIHSSPLAKCKSYKLSIHWIENRKTDISKNESWIWFDSVFPVFFLLSKKSLFSFTAFDFLEESFITSSNADIQSPNVLNSETGSRWTESIFAYHFIWYKMFWCCFVHAKDFLKFPKNKNSCLVSDSCSEFICCIFFLCLCCTILVLNVFIVHAHFNWGSQVVGPFHTLHIQRLIELGYDSCSHLVSWM